MLEIGGRKVEWKIREMRVLASKPDPWETGRPVIPTGVGLRDIIEKR